MIRIAPHISDPPSVQDTGTRFTRSMKPECELDPKNDIEEDEGPHMPRLTQGPGSKLMLRNQSSIRPHAGADLSPQPIPLQCTDEVSAIERNFGAAYNITSSAKANSNSRITAGIVPMIGREVTPVSLQLDIPQTLLPISISHYIPFGPTEP
ncbi:hypothetical protein BS47DRAFT_581004 [Hydnum rufescens UP504]|uniref:Uncharacterized protein n=1 Tax=Hydnum rufescens UP504 TaxID=1448309 RepID=A0A9P6AGS7_9AGAM|nr:hypothetical protein BS47DRAFT_581004 [Hydnum rufescens UP504]